MMDVIQEANSNEDLSDLLTFLEKHLPSSCDLHTQLVFHMKSHIPGDRFYYLRDPSSGAFIAIVGLMLYNRLHSDETFQRSWMITAWSIEPIHLDRVYREINVIDWEKDFVRMFRQENQPSQVMRTFLSEKNRGAMESLPMNLYAISLNDAVGFEPRMPEEIYVKDLNPSHALEVHDKWWGKDSASVDCITDVITHLPSVGIFLKGNDQLITWAVCHPPGGGISHLYTLEEHRGKGYGLLAVQCLSKQLALVGLVPFATITPGNEASLKLFTKLGFHYVRDIHFLC